MRLTATQITTALQDLKCFEGVFARDRLPLNVSKPALLVVNTDDSSEPGEHWVSVYTGVNNKAIFFNSFGLPPLSPEVIDFVARNATSLQYCNVVLQDAFSETCGYFCIAFGRHVAKGGTLSSFVSFFTHQGVTLQEPMMSSSYDCCAAIAA